MFSTDDGNKVIVKPEHIQFVSDYLHEIFAKPSMGYDIFSAAYRQSVNLTEDKRRKLTREFCVMPEYEILRELFLEHHTFRKMEIVDQMGYDMEQAKNLFKWLNRNKLARSTSVGYVKQPIFTNFLKALKPVEIKRKEHTFNV